MPKLEDAERIVLPDPSLVLLIGPAGSGKSTFARKHFKPTEILSSDFFRALLSDDENNQRIHAEVFDAVHFVARLRLKLRRLTVIDATNLEARFREPFFEMAKQFDIPVVGIVFDIGEAACFRQDAKRRRSVGDRVLSYHHSQLQRTLSEIENEPFARLYRIRSAWWARRVQVERERRSSRRRSTRRGPSAAR